MDDIPHLHWRIKGTCRMQSERRRYLTFTLSFLFIFFVSPYFPLDIRSFLVKCVE
jgi:hypothetical protein